MVLTEKQLKGKLKLLNQINKSFRDAFPDASPKMKKKWKRVTLKEYKRFIKD